jgi:dihydroorotase
MDLREDGAYKMNPPLRSAEDKAALIQGIKDGTIDCIATDHAPHAASEKICGLKDSAFGITGLEVAFPLLFSYLVKKNIITMERLIDLMSTNPRKIMGLHPVTVGEYADLTIVNLESDYKLNPNHFVSSGKSTPFAGWKVNAECVMTMIKGEIVYSLYNS